MESFFAFLPPLLALLSIVFGFLDKKLNSRNNWQIIISFFVIIFYSYVFYELSDEIEFFEPKYKEHKIEDINDALEILNETESFPDVIIGIGGRVALEVKAFKLILQNEDANKNFITLYEKGKLPGKLIALSGLYFTDRSMQKKLITEFNSIDDSVYTQSGCIVYKIPVDSLIEGIKSGNIPNYYKNFSF